MINVQAKAEFQLPIIRVQRLSRKIHFQNTNVFSALQTLLIHICKDGVLAILSSILIFVLSQSFGQMLTNAYTLILELSQFKKKPSVPREEFFVSKFKTNFATIFQKHTNTLH